VDNVKDSSEVDAVPPLEVPRNNETNNEPGGSFFPAPNTAVVAFGRRSNTEAASPRAPARGIAGGIEAQRKPDQGNGFTWST
jgi:hypothetical protein